MLALFAFTHKGYVPVDGGKLYYEERGKGEALILLHGNTLDTRMWDGQFKEFARHYRTVRFDFRGYGKSSLPIEGQQFTYADDLLVLMDSLKIEKAHIVGLSMGSFVASEMLAICPERMLSATLAVGLIKTYPGPSTPADSAEIAKKRADIEAVKAYGVEQKKKDWYNSLLESAGSGRDRLAKPLWKQINDWSAWQWLHVECRTLYAKDAADIFYSHTYEVPTLILRDRHSDGKHPSMMKQLPNSEFKVMEDCGHMMNMEQPKLFNRTVLEFLSKI